MKAFVLACSILCTINSVSSCPEKCECTSRRADCSNAGLTSIPELPIYLEEIILSHNSIQSVGDGLLNGPNIQHIDLSHNEIEELSVHAFSNITYQLEYLNLSYNSLSDGSLKNFELFRPVRQIKTLDLSHNSFTRIPDSDLKLLTNLKQLHIQNNGLTDPILGPDLKSLDDLEYLDMSGSYFTNIPSHAFQNVNSGFGTKELKTFKLSRCNIRTVETEAFSSFLLSEFDISGNPQISYRDLNRTIQEISNCPELHTLNLSQTSLNNLSYVLFSLINTPLRRLDLSYNQISLISVLDLRQVKGLRYLNLNNNRLSDLPMLSLSQLEYLDLSHNKFALLHSTALEGCESLRHVDISHNQMTEFDTNPFSRNTNMKILDMSYNSIREISNVMYPEYLEELDLQGNVITDPTLLLEMYSVEKLNLAFNEISDLPAQLTKERSQLLYLNLTGNQIKRIDAETFRLKTPEILDLSDNKLTQLSDWGLTFIKSLNLSKNEIAYISTTCFAHWRWLHELDLSNNELVNLPANTFTDLSALRSLDLSSNHLAEFLVGYNSATLFNAGDLKIEYLSLKKNNINNLRNSFFSNLTLLTKLDISENSLDEITSQLLNGLSVLQVLNVADNNLTSFSLSAISTLVNLREIDLSDVRWSCDCSIRDVKRWLDSGDIVLINYEETKHYMCDKPASMQGTHISLYNPTEESCSPAESMEKTIILIIIGCTSFIILIVAAIIFWQHRWRLKKRVKKQQYRAISERPQPPLPSQPPPNGTPLINHQTEHHQTSPMQPNSMHYMESSHHHHPRNHHHHSQNGGAFV